jgi:hypothetical protein
MPACEKCWADAWWLAKELGGYQADRYEELLRERKDNPCTKEQQEGKDAKL